MNTLFPLEPQYPDGFVYFPAFLTYGEEEALLATISKIELHTFNFHGYEAKRKVASFGYDYSFDNNLLTKGKEIPAVFDPLIEKIAQHVSLEQQEIAELLVTEYPSGAVINWHRDAAPFDLIAGISLASDCIFRLRPYDKAKQTRASVISIPVKRRSLYIMQGISRTDWQHSISPVEETRFSVTVRTLRKKQ